MNTKRFKPVTMYSASFSVMSLSVFAQSAFAASTYPNPTPHTSIAAFISAAMDIALSIGILILVVMIVYAGFLFVTARGNEERLKSAKHALSWAIIGGALVLGAWALSVAIHGTISSL